MLSKLAPVHKPSRSPYKLFYQVLGIPVTELEHKKQFKLLFYSPEDQGEQTKGNQHHSSLWFLVCQSYDSYFQFCYFSEREVVFYVNKAPRIVVSDILNEMSKVVSEEHPVTLRLLEISAHKIVNIIENDVTADIITNNNSPNSKYTTTTFQGNGFDG